MLKSYAGQMEKFEIEGGPRLILTNKNGILGSIWASHIHIVEHLSPMGCEAVSLDTYWLFKMS